TVENDTASTIVGLEVASLSTGAWRPADLDHASLKPGDSVRAHTDRSGCEYDVRARLKTGAVIRQDDVDLCDLDSDPLVIEGEFRVARFGALPPWGEEVPAGRRGGGPRRR